MNDVCLFLLCACAAKANLAKTASDCFGVGRSAALGRAKGSLGSSCVCRMCPILECWPPVLWGSY